MAGYSGTPLPQKLGLKPNGRFGVYAAPKDFEQALGALPDGAAVVNAARGTSTLDVIACFVASQAELLRLLPRARERLDPQGGLWLCWPKKTSGLKTDLSESEVRNAGLEAGLVDNKVCAIDERWSGLRFVVRLKDRSASKRSAQPAPSNGRAPSRTKTPQKSSPVAAQSKRDSLTQPGNRARR